MGSWEDKLVDDLKTAALEQASARAHATEEPLAKSYRETIDRFDAAITTVKERTGIPVQASGDADRHRWQSGQHTLTVRLDRAAGKYFVSADLGRDIVIEEVTAMDGQLMDGRLRPLATEELAQRFVRLLFRGA